MDVPARPARALGLTLELVRLAGPIVGLNLAYALLGLTDTLFMGRLGPTQVAAAGLGNLVYITFFLLLRGTVNGIVPFASRAWGAGDLAECGRHLRGFLWLALILSLAVLVLRPLFVPVFTLIGPAPGVLSGAATFAQIRALEIPFALISTALLSFRVSVGDSRTPMLITWGGVLTNVGLNWLLVFGHLGFPALGLRGSAVGTVIAVALQAVVAVLIVLPARERRRFSLAFAWPSAAELRRLARVGLPMGLTEFAEVSAFSAFFGLLARLGTFELAASQIANQIASAAFMAGFALATATASLVGRMH